MSLKAFGLYRSGQVTVKDRKGRAFNPFAVKAGQVFKGDAECAPVVELVIFSIQSRLSRHYSTHGLCRGGS